MRTKLLAQASLLALLALFLSGCPETKRQTAPAVVTETPVATLARRDIEESVEASGFVESVRSPLDVRAEIGGRVTNLFVENGTRVTKGMRLVELDDTTVRADLEENTRNAQLAALDLERAERDKLRQESLFTEGFATEKARADAKTDAEFAKLRLRVAEARVEKAKANLAKTVVKAPFDGFVSDLNVAQDQVLAGGGAPLLRLYDFSRLRVVVKFNEFDAARLAPGRPGTIVFDSLPGTGVPGVLSYVSPFAAPEQNLRVFTARVDFSPKDAPVRPGVSATVRIVTRRATGVVAAPVAAVFTEGRECVVYLKNNAGGFDRRVVKTGLADAGFVEITEGAAEGDRVALARPQGRR